MVLDGGQCRKGGGKRAKCEREREKEKISTVVEVWSRSRSAEDGPGVPRRGDSFFPVPHSRQRGTVTSSGPDQAHGNVHGHNRTQSAKQRAAKATDWKLNKGSRRRGKSA